MPSSYRNILVGSLIISSLYLFFTYTSSPINKLPTNNNNIALNIPTGSYDNSDNTAEFHGKEIPVPKERKAPEGSNVLGSNTDKKRVEIDLTNQKLYAYEGDNKIFSFLISSGKWGQTPTGEFRIWTKLRYTLMTGGNEEWETYYYLPNVPYTMYFYNDEIPKSRGYGIHGAYWHDNFGHPMSHGCINMKTEEVEQLFFWANPVIKDGQHSVYADEENTGTRVIIYGEAPNE